jgi:hypothetical protein
MAGPVWSGLVQLGAEVCFQRARKGVDRAWVSWREQVVSFEVVDADETVRGACVAVGKEPVWQ